MRRAPFQSVAQRERQLENARHQEMVREETLKNLGREKLLESNMNREDRLENKRFIRTQMQEQKEREMEETILKVTLTCLIANLSEWKFLYQIIDKLCVINSYLTIVYMYFYFSVVNNCMIFHMMHVK